MRDLKNTGVNDRLQSQKAAKAALLAKFKPKPTVQDPEFELLAAKREAEREALRQQRELEKSDQRRQRAEVEAVKMAEVAAAQDAIEEARRAERKARKALTKEEQKQRRDERYAARKARSR